MKGLLGIICFSSSIRFFYSFHVSWNYPYLHYTSSSVHFLPTVRTPESPGLLSLTSGSPLGLFSWWVTLACFFTSAKFSLYTRHCSFYSRFCYLPPKSLSLLPAYSIAVRSPGTYGIEFQALLKWFISVYSLCFCSVLHYAREEASSASLKQTARLTQADPFIRTTIVKMILPLFSKKLLAGEGYLPTPCVTAFEFWHWLLFNFKGPNFPSKIIHYLYPWIFLYFSSN